MYLSTPPSTSRPAFSKILLIKLKQQGDSVLMTPVLRVLRRLYPEAVIDLLIPEGCKDLFDHHPSLKKGTLYGLGKRGFVKKVKLFFTLAKTPYDLILNLSESSKGHLVSLFHPKAVKVALHPGKKPGIPFKIYDHLVRHGLNNRHQVERDLDSLRMLGLEILDEDKDLELGLNPSNLITLLEKLPLELQSKQSYIVIQPTSRKEFKEIPIPTMARVVQELKDRGYTLVLSAGKSPHEIYYVEELKRLAGSAFAATLAGGLNLQELLHLLSRSQGVLTVDSLGVHLASCFKIPHLVLFGPTADLRWGPWNNPNAAIYTLPMACRPCLLEGCGSSGVSDCLVKMKAEKIVEAFVALPLANTKQPTKTASIH